jgi:cytochrome c oxidase subunit 2
MIFTVTAVPRAEYAAWTEDMAAPAATPTGGDAQRGEAAFTRLPCGSCHTVRGTPAAGTEGPDLTHFASRTSLGAGAAANNKGNLAAWIADPDYFKPGALMPDVPMSDRDFQAVLAYVESLK